MKMKKKNFVHKNQGQEPTHQITRQMRAQVDTTQRKNKNNQTKIRLKPYANRTHSYEMMNNDNKENLR
jgi:hypothetical protein